MHGIPLSKEFLKSGYRKKMWTDSVKTLKLLEKTLPISSVWLRGSFATNKKKPSDIDFIILLRTPKNHSSCVSADFKICLDNKSGKAALRDSNVRMKKKYGKKFEVVRLK